MLKKLWVKSFAIIEDLSVDFSNGMTVLTGETGAGKSLLIDCISLLLGSRADTDMIRYNDDLAIIKGEFTYANPKMSTTLDNYGIPHLDNNIVIEREISKSSKSQIKINNVAINLSILKIIAADLADIHTQGDTFRLFNPETYLQFIDPKEDEDFNNCFNDYQLAYSKYSDSLDNYNKIKNKKNDSLKQIEFLEYEKNELGSLDLYPGKDTELEEKINKMANYDKIFQSLSATYNYLSNEYFNTDNIYDAYMDLKKIASYDSNYDALKDKLLESYDNIEEAKKQINVELTNMDYDSALFDELNKEYDTLKKTMEKYHKSVDELIVYLKDITLELDMINNYDSVLEEAINALSKAFSSCLKKGKALSDKRKKIALGIENAIVNECVSLDLENTKFKIDFENIIESDIYNKQIFKDNGIDNVDFLISMNKGEPLKPLSKVASGGELSRIMLAFKSYFAKTSNLSLMVFDEIDTGVSGHTASEIAKKIKSIAKYTQVLCITHMPQVAAIGDNHIYIYKETINNRTITKLELLDDSKRIEMIAFMLSGDKISKAALEHAKELLLEARS